jgi:glycerophosphoryl diester phosphodiesterase
MQSVADTDRAMAVSLLLVICALSVELTSSLHAFVNPTRFEFDHGIDLPTTRPLVIAHRGSSGSLPEHTVLSYQRAVDEGADVIECDLTISRDLVLLCLHENWINSTTNIADVYSFDRANSYYVADQLRVITDYFAVDFTLAELKPLVRKKQQFTIRDPNYNDQLEIATFDEFVSVAKNAGRPGNS